MVGEESEFAAVATEEKMAAAERMEGIESFILLMVN